MDGAFGEIRTIPASGRAKSQMKQLLSKLPFNEQRDIWRLGAALGISMNKTLESGKRETFQNINSLDPEGIFSAIMTGLYPDCTPEERLKRLVDHAEWGINELFHKDTVGTLEFAQLIKSVEKKIP